jgi:hypothetical protein
MVVFQWARIWKMDMNGQVAGYQTWRVVSWYCAQRSLSRVSVIPTLSISLQITMPIRNDFFAKANRDSALINHPVNDQVDSLAAVGLTTITGHRWDRGYSQISTCQTGICSLVSPESTHTKGVFICSGIYLTDLRICGSTGGWTSRFGILCCNA